MKRVMEMKMANGMTMRGWMKVLDQGRERIVRRKMPWLLDTGKLTVTCQPN